MLKTNFTYADISFFPRPNPFNGDLNLVKDVNAIKQSLKNIVMTAKREKPFNYLFGGNPREYLFETLTPYVMWECKNLIAHAINTFEPRVTVDDIVIYTPNRNPNTMIIVIPFKINKTNTIDSISISIERTR
jgi:phage baseplate assembly protein W